MKVQIKDLQEKVKKGVEKLGYLGEDADIITEVLLYAEMRGNNQGISKIATGGVPEASEVGEYRIVKENKCGAMTAGGHSMVASARAADKVVELAKQHGVGVVVSNRTQTSSGAIGYFARRVSRAGYICFMTVGNGGFDVVAPHGSAEGRLGTNPLAYAFPYEGGEVVFDCATAAIAFFGLVQARLSGESIPAGVAINARGEDTTDPNQVLESGDGEDVGGAIKTFAGYKGFGLSLFVQVMGSAFAGGDISGSDTERGAGTFLMAIDPALLVEKEEYMSRCREQLDHIRSAKGIDENGVVLPGERGDAIERQAIESGEIEIADGVWNKLCDFVSS